jgi:hypothetical protein
LSAGDKIQLPGIPTCTSPMRKTFVDDCAIAPEQRATAARIVRAIRARMTALPSVNNFYANVTRVSDGLGANSARMSICAL